MPALYRTTTQYDEDTMLDASTMIDVAISNAAYAVPNTSTKSIAPYRTVHKICAARRPGP